jgi:aminoglycoside phosphotransferase (APT) family kinase protein
MSVRAILGRRAILDLDLEIGLGKALAGAGLPGEPVQLEHRRHWSNCSSFAIEELRVQRAGDAPLVLLFKDLSRWRMIEPARSLKPRFLYAPLREILVYEEILSKVAVGTPAYHGCVVVPRMNRYWLFLERVLGWELYQEGDFSVWEAAARWLGQLHARLAALPENGAGLFAQYALKYDGAFFRRWMRRAMHFCHISPHTLARRNLAALARRHGNVVERLTALPVTLVHGEFVASNILVAPGDGVFRICPVDWEMAGFGPGLMDLAALSAGDWDEASRRALCRAYLGGLHALKAETAREVFSESQLAETMRDLDCCRLQLAVQWLGWASNWEPPAAHARDWAREALDLADQLAL